MQERLHCQGLPRDVVPSATVRHATASAGEMARLASTSSAAAGPKKATVWMRLRTVVTGTPRRTRPSASSPAAELPTAMTCTCRSHGCTSLLSAITGTADCWANHKRGRTSHGRKARKEDDFMSSFSAWKAWTGRLLHLCGHHTVLLDLQTLTEPLGRQTCRLPGTKHLP